ncbi:MAG: fumarylacetoacetate hydrolase family protein [Acidobacteria bacterium]|nr:fumarylacetoacetate hydrolase family protein [Acidobacteriota bacterium]
MHRILCSIGALLVMAGVVGWAGQNVPTVASEPFKLGTFEIGGTPALGLVLRDGYVVELDAANRDYERKSGGEKIQVPADMIALIERYEGGLNRRLAAIARQLVADGKLAGATRPAYVRDVAQTRALAPILYPSKMLNAAGNYYGHVSENLPPEEQRKIADERRRDRGTPYLFLKATRGAIIGDGGDIILPRGRDKIDWECEIGVVIGRRAKYVPADQAKNYIFGYTIELDMSDRGGRPGEKEPRSDWFVGKSHDTFAPMGPYIVPKEFFGDPMNVGQKLSVNGTVMQDGRSTDMIHNIYELIEFGSSIMTLFPGDVISAGSPAGTGMSRSARPEQVFLKPGDKVVATVEGIGTLTHTARAETVPSSAAR